MARAGRRAAAEKGSATLHQLQQLQLQYGTGGELKAVHSGKEFKISECSDNW